MVDFENLTDEEYAAQLRLLFRTDGWEILMQEILDLTHQINDTQDIKTLEQLWHTKGQLAMAARLLNLEDTVERADTEEQES